MARSAVGAVVAIVAGVGAVFALAVPAGAGTSGYIGPGATASCGGQTATVVSLVTLPLASPSRAGCVSVPMGTPYGTVQAIDAMGHGVPVGVVAQDVAGNATGSWSFCSGTGGMYLREADAFISAFALDPALSDLACGSPSAATTGSITISLSPVARTCNWGAYYDLQPASIGFGNLAGLDCLGYATTSVEADLRDTTGKVEARAGTSGCSCADSRVAGVLFPAIPTSHHILHIEATTLGGAGSWLSNAFCVGGATGYVCNYPITAFPGFGVAATSEVHLPAPQLILQNATGR